MAPKRPELPFSTPPRTSSAPRPSAPTGNRATRAPACNMNGNIVGAQSVLVPPSPGLILDTPPNHDTQPDQDHETEISAQASSSESDVTIEEVDTTGSPSKRPSKGRYAAKKDPAYAGIKKNQKSTNKVTINKKLSGVIAAAQAAATDSKELDVVFRFLDLPPEIRNLVYEHSMSDSRQALVVHRPRMASLRSHTRLDRYRPMESDVKDQELGRELDTRRDTRANTDTISRESFRPFITLTHVCRQIRDEYRPIFLEKQEIGMDVTEAVAYLQTFYSGAPQEFKKLGFRPNRKGDLPYTGNLTIALGGTLKDIEKLPEGVQVLPLLDIWANSFKMEAGFGRYQQHGYVPERDGEAKDLYRLFGRQVYPNRLCSGMNGAWRQTLRGRHLASVTIHREPEHQMVTMGTLYGAGGRLIPAPGWRPGAHLHALIPVLTKPYIHLLYLPRHAEPWMVQPESIIPPVWLARRGFHNMEHFDIKVGLAPDGLDARL